MGFALFENGQQVSKTHPLRDIALIEAVERKVVWVGSSDFIGDGMHGYIHWRNGFEIREINESPKDE